jgi:hypothetical protein
MCVVAELRAIDLRSSHQFEEEIGAASSENGLFIAKMEFSVLTRTIGSSNDELTLHSASSVSRQRGEQSGDTKR